MRHRIWMAVAVGIVLAGALVWKHRSGRSPEPLVAALPQQPAPPPVAAAPQRPFRILHIMSYDSSWAEWTVAQLDAFKQVLADLPVEYQVIEMDVKRNTSDAWKQQIIARTRETIDTWKPDLVYTTDDFVQTSIVPDYFNSDIPFVFSGVNGDPVVYGFSGSRNVTGVLEREHIVQTAALLRSIVPGARRLAVITDTGETWPGVIRRIQALQSEMRMQVVAVDVVDTFEQYKQKIASYPSQADAICTLGIFTLKDKDGQHVPFKDVGRWTFENCPLPNVSFWDSRPPVGALCAVAVSPRSQGRGAGRIARAILVDKRSPSDFPIEPSVTGEPIINLAVAKRLHLKVPSTTVLTAKVLTKLDWE